MNKHAQALGKLGGKSKSPAKIAASKENGKRGGKARAKSLSPQRRLEISRKANSAKKSKK